MATLNHFIYYPTENQIQRTALATLQMTFQKRQTEKQNDLTSNKVDG